MATATGDDPHPDQAAGSTGEPAGPSTTTSAPAASISRGNGFFQWIRGLGILRTPGWIGGVCAGIAARLGIDALIVRGIVVVIAVLGGPIVLLYAAAWLLLPDEDDLIHAEEVGRGRFTPAIAGIGALALLSLLSLGDGSWYTGPYGDVANARGVIGEVIGRLVWVSILVTAIVLFVIWVSRRSGDSRSAASAATASYRAWPAADAATDPTPWPAATVGAAAAFAPEPPMPGVAASNEELAAWRQQQEEWKRQRAAWAAEQKRSDRELASKAAQENARRNAEAAIERARIRRLTRPRVSGAYVIIAIGAAIAAGALAALFWVQDGGGYDATVGWGAAVLVLGTAIVLAGALRKRSGVLALLSIVALVGMLASSAAPSGRQLLFPGSSYGIPTMRSGQYAQPAGSLMLVVHDDGTDEIAEIDVWQGDGTVDVLVEPSQTVRVEAVTDGRNVQVLTRSADGVEAPAARDVVYRSVENGRFASTTTIGAPGQPDVILTLWQGRGSVRITGLAD